MGDAKKPINHGGSRCYAQKEDFPQVLLPPQAPSRCQEGMQHCRRREARVHQDSPSQHDQSPRDDRLCCGCVQWQGVQPSEIKADMVAHYLGEFSITYKPVKHGTAGIGATKSSRFAPLKQYFTFWL